MLALVFVTLAVVVVLLVAEKRDLLTWIWIAKPLASTGFVCVAVAAGALAGDAGCYGRWVLAGLCLSWWGDVLLIPKGRPAVFRAGVIAFLLGHLAYAAAFASRGLAPVAALSAGLVISGVGWLVLRWLRPHLPAEMRLAVPAYVVVISGMLVCAVASVAAAGGPAILLGAGMFYVSDLAVARDRFVSPGFANRAWGLPLYYGGQLVLAASVA